MNEAFTTEPTTDEAVQMQKDIDNALAEIKRLREQMQSEQSAIEASRKRTRAMLARLQAG